MKEKPKSSLQKLDEAIFRNLGKHLTIKQNQKLLGLTVDRLCVLIDGFGFRPQKPMGWLTQFIESLDSPLLKEAGQRRGGIKEKKDKGFTKLTFNQEE